MDLKEALRSLEDAVKNAEPTLRQAGSFDDKPTPSRAGVAASDRALQAHSAVLEALINVATGLFKAGALRRMPSEQRKTSVDVVAHERYVITYGKTAAYFRAP